jgi:hypothetical protein
MVISLRNKWTVIIICYTKLGLQAEEEEEEEC